MTKGFQFDPGAGTIIFRDGARDALVLPDGTLVNLLPTEFTLTNHDESWPDADKDRVYFHTWNMQRTGDENWWVSETGTIQIGAKPQEWASTVVLGDAPDDTDIFCGLIRLQRTVAPSHNWAGIAIAPMVKQSVWLPFFGSVPLEACLGIFRAMSIYIDLDSGSPTHRKLILHKQQSVSVPSGGYGDKPGSPGGEPPSISTIGWSNGISRNGGILEPNADQSIPVYWPGTNTTPHYQQYGPLDMYTGPGPIPLALAPPKRTRKGGSQQPTITDPTNYGSTWRINLRGQFGRRS